MRLKKPADINLAEFFYKVRRKARKTQQEMADLLETHIRTYQHWEYGTKEPSGQITAKVYNLNEQIKRAKRLKKSIG